MAEYAVLIVGDADRWWTTMTEQERTTGYAEYDRFAAELTRRGHRITGGAELRPTTEAVHLRPGAREATDGPFAEGVEQIGGFYLVESDDLADLVDCTRILSATGEGIEIRRCVEPQERP